MPPQIIYKGVTNHCHPRFQFPNDWDITHSKKHWSTENTTLQYIRNIIFPYVESQRDNFEGNPAAIVIMDNFKGQITAAVTELLESKDIYVVLLPPNTTDLLQPMDLTVNKPAKEFLRKKFQHWYSEKITSQLQGDTSECELAPVDMSLAVMKELSAKWLVEMVQYLSDNPHFIVKGFTTSGIAGALDGFRDNEVADEEDPEDYYSSDDDGDFGIDDCYDFGDDDSASEQESQIE